MTSPRSHAPVALLALCALMLTPCLAEAQDAIQEVMDNTLTASLSGCGMCQQTGMCDHAFRGGIGQFCHTLVSGTPCCCPADAQCVANMYNCRCQKTFRQQPARAVPAVHHSSGSSHAMLWVALLILLCCVCCCINNRSREEEQQYAPPVVMASTTTYGATASAPANPSYPAYPTAQPAYPPAAPSYYPAPAYQAAPAPVIIENNNGGSGGGGGGGAFAAGALGAAAGFATGMLVDSAMRRDEDRGGYFTGDTGFSASEVTYEFSGDDGGGDYDAGDFGGDS
ncbi:TPA: hypothetical protein N0F65_011294 [Lagenidium giganteum]|uniref:Uncharacterized protein n=1 Tax=Lagenidium giganteum TaxID=4803 RepID=A0AAV2YTJ9_9STRA|nr:TPA: hypothetical protein N0F65_011294 [Lagenidium giganteum]